MSDSTPILDFSNTKIKRMVLDHIKRLEGPHRFQVKKVKRQRSLPQNAYLWGVVYKAVQAGIEEAWGERKSVEWIHAYLKKKFLTEPVVNRRTGEVVDEATGSTAALGVSEFAEYIEQVINFAGEYLGVTIPQTFEEALASSTT